MVTRLDILPRFHKLLDIRGASQRRNGISGENSMSNKGGDEAVWFSALCAAAAYMAQAKFPSVAMSGIFLIMLMWTFWSLLKMLMNRM
jgi:hypothetical protein